jgi:hypothetical protein
MLRNAIIVSLVCACIALAGCGGGGGLERELSKKPGECQVVADANEVGTPAKVRCVITGDPDFDLLRFTWTWNVNHGTVVEKSSDGTVAWIAIDEPGVCQVYARGVDKDGKDCTTPRHLIKSHAKYNAPPEPLPDGPIDDGFGEMSDNDGTPGYRYHQWRWTPGRSYDAEGDTFDTQFFILLEADLDGDGEFDALSNRAGDGSVRTADLDRDGRPDLMVMQSKGDEFIVRELFRTMSKEDVYVWKMAIKEQGITPRKKEFKGHVTLLK